MKFIVTFIFFMVVFFPSLGQSESSCFAVAKRYHDSKVDQLGLGRKFSPSVDSLIKYLTAADFDSLSLIKEQTKTMLAGCIYPTTIFRNSNNKDLIIGDIKTKFLIINFNDMFCQHCLNQLNDLLLIKNEMKQNVTIISIFPQEKSEMGVVLNKYKDSFEFILGSRKYIETHNLFGMPMSIVLDKYKFIQHISTGACDNVGFLYKELTEHMK